MYDRLNRLALLAVLAGLVGLPARVFSQELTPERADCIDKLCKGDTPPQSREEETVLKLNGQWFFAPRSYVRGTASLVFYWPSKAPLTGMLGKAPDVTRDRPYEQVAIEIFLRSTRIPRVPIDFAFTEFAERKGWIAKRTKVRPGLESLQMKPVLGPNGMRIDHVTYYIATDLRGLDGKPPVATCAQSLPDDIGGTGFMWRDGIWVGVRMNQRHCADWPEIFLEVTRVLAMLRKA